MTLATRIFFLNQCQESRQTPPHFLKKEEELVSWYNVQVGILKKGCSSEYCSTFISKEQDKKRVGRASSSRDIEKNGRK
jgi:hypothetical protein